MNANRQLYGDFRVPEQPEGKPLIIFCHGFKGFKDWGGWQYAMDKFCMSGFFVIALNFSYNGIGPDLQNFTDLKKFVGNTIGRELKDLEILLKSLKKGEEFPEISRQSRIGLIGHSRGGGTVILFASQNDNIDCIVTWASISSFNNYLSRRAEWRKKGYIEFENKRTKQMMRMNIGFLNDLERNPAKRDILKAESRLGLPHLIIHGYNDESVPYQEAQDLFDVSSKSITRLEIIHGGTHTFGITHPFTGSNPVFDSVTDKTAKWFRKYL
ncbi:hypothetical protein AMJ80_08145 [bacterium SM23_31]|nr:MAG: hypothetical protein AMJ80_08145 [bacterium SM23_31]